MAAPTYADSTNQAGETDTSIDLVLMATINANDIILVSYGYRGTNSFATPTHTSLTFTAVQAKSGGAISNQQWWWARAAGGEGGTTVTCTRTGGGTLAFHCQAHRFTGCITSGSPIDATVGAIQEITGAGPTVDFEAMTLAGDDELIVVGYFEADDDQTTAINFSTVDVTFTQVFKRLDIAGNDTNWTIYTGPNGAGDTSISATSMTQSAADEYSIQQFALLPAAAATTTSLPPVADQLQQHLRSR
jgi:hypothetical protein